MTAGTDLRSLSVYDYHRMVEGGILAADERVELIEGQLHIAARRFIRTCSFKDADPSFPRRREPNVGFPILRAFPLSRE